MQLSRETRADANIVRAYAPGRIRVNDRTITASVVMTAGQILDDWPPRRIDELSPAHLQSLIALEPEIVILGTGSTICFPPPVISSAILQRGIGFEVMDNAAACRTYNVLVQEGRRVALALLIAE